MTKKSLLIVEDETQIRKSLVDFFHLQGYEVASAATGDEGLRLALAKPPDLLLLDVMLPGIHGFDVCRRLRAEGFTSPVIFVTAKGEEADKLCGFDGGGDDYVTKPFSLLELHARVRAQLRKVEKEGADEEQFAFDTVQVNFRTYDLTVEGKPVRLSAKEMELLKFLVKNRGQVLTREVLLDKVWQKDGDEGTRTVDTHILNLRRKLQDGPPNRYIQTVHGVGYKFSVG